LLEKYVPAVLQYNPSCCCAASMVWGCLRQDGSKPPGSRALQQAAATAAGLADCRSKRCKDRLREISLFT
jgi:hypothetical protein